MECEIYELDFSGKLTPVDTSQNNDLQPGRIIWWGGNMAWQPEKFVIIERLESGYGMSYRMVSLKDFRYHMTQSYSMKMAGDKNCWHSQHMFITNQYIKDADLENIKQKAIKKKADDDAIAEIESQKREAFKKKYETPDAIKPGDVLHYSYGYDATYNVFAVVLENTGKTLKCKKIRTSLTGGDFDMTAEPNKDGTKGETFRVYIKWRNYDGKKYYSLAGEGHHWSVHQEGTKYYENHMD